MLWEQNSNTSHGPPVLEVRLPHRICLFSNLCLLKGPFCSHEEFGASANDDEVTCMSGDARNARQNIGI